MNTHLMCKVVAFVIGTILVVIGVINIFWWIKRDRWQNCVGIIKNVKSGKDSEGYLWHQPRIQGNHNSEYFEFNGIPSKREVEIGTQVAVRYDPVHRRYFDCDNFTIIASIIGPIFVGPTLLILAWIF